MNELDASRFWSKVDRSGGDDACWMWIASTRGWGYGQFWLDGREVVAHRVAYESVFGPIPHGMHLLHHCDNPPCVNHRHLFIGTSADNMADRDAKGRTARGERHGSRTHPERFMGEGSPGAKLTEEQVREIRCRRADGESQRAVARAFCVAPSTINAIARRKSWAHVS